MDDAPLVADRYALIAELGRGGMGVVYAARDVRSGDAVALKVGLRPSPTAVQRLVAEGAAQARLDHPNVVRVRRVTRWGEAPVLVMDRVRGPTLAMPIADGPVPLAEVDALARGVLAGVAAAHALGLVHRDLKPSNVLVAVDDDRITARVADFGLVRDLARAAGPTRTTDLIGTPMYSAPEQLEDPAWASVGTDVFALGALLYELVTGVRALEGTNALQLHDFAAREAWAAPEDLRPDLPPRMARAIAGALRAVPDERFPSVDALASAWIGDAPPPPRPAPARRAHVRALAPAGRPVGALPELLAAEVGAQNPHNLPRRADRFVGRAVELAVLVQHSAAHRLVTVTGPAGTGKTRLAVAFGRRALARSRGGVWMVALADATDAADIRRATAAALGMGRGRHGDDAIVANLASAGPILLLLDNFEQLVPHAAETVGRWLAAVPGLRVVVTSRAPLGLPDEQVVPLEPLGEREAVDLFVVRARARDPRFQLTDANRADVGAIVRAFDGLPLAIELVAARVRLVGVARLRARIDQRFKLASSRGSSRHATLRRAIDGSWERLDDAERAVFAQCSVFAGRFDVPAAAAVLEADGDPVDVLWSLVAKSLVRRVPGPVRFELLVSLRAYAAGKLAEVGTAARDRAWLRHARWFAGKDLSWRTRVDGHVATRRAIQLGAFPLAARLLYVHAPRTVKSGGVAEVRALSEQVMARVQGADRLLVGAMLAYTMSHQGEREAAYALVTDLIADAGDTADLRVRLRLQNVAESICWYRGDFDGVGRHGPIALALARERGSARHVAGSMLSMARLAQRRGAYAEATALLEEARVVASDADLVAKLATADLDLGVIRCHQGRATEALPLFRAAARGYAATGDERRRGWALFNVAAALGDAGDPEATRAACDAAIAVARRVDDTWTHARSLLVRADHVAEPRPLVVEAMALAERGGHAGVLAAARVRLALDDIRAGHTTGREAIVRDAMATLRRFVQIHDVLTGHAALVALAAADGDAEALAARRADFDRWRAEHGMIGASIDRLVAAVDGLSVPQAGT